MDDFPSQNSVTRSFGVYFICAWTKGRVNNRYSGNLRSPGAQYDVTVMHKLLHIRVRYFSIWCFDELHVTIDLQCNSVKHSQELVLTFKSTKIDHFELGYPSCMQRNNWWMFLFWRIGYFRVFKYMQPPRRVLNAGRLMFRWQRQTVSAHIALLSPALARW